MLQWIDLRREDDQFKKQPENDASCIYMHIYSRKLVSCVLTPFLAQHWINPCISIICVNPVTLYFQIDRSVGGWNKIIVIIILKGRHYGITPNPDCRHHVKVKSQGWIHQRDSMQSFWQFWVSMKEQYPYLSCGEADKCWIFPVIINIGQITSLKSMWSLEECQWRSVCRLPFNPSIRNQYWTLEPGHEMKKSCRWSMYFCCCSCQNRLPLVQSGWLRCISSWLLIENCHVKSHLEKAV